MKKYKHKPTEIQAIQYTKENKKKIKELLKDDLCFEFTKEGLKYHGFDSYTPIVIPLL